MLMRFWLNTARNDPNIMTVTMMVLVRAVLLRRWGLPPRNSYRCCRRYALRNAIIYLFTDAPRQGEVLFAYDVALLRGFQVYVPASSLADIHCILHRNGLSGRALDEAMESLFALFDVFDATGQDGRKALANGMRDFEDAIIAESAYRNGVDLIITYNTEGFAKSPVKAMDAAEFVRLFKPAKYDYAEISG